MVVGSWIGNRHSRFIAWARDWRIWAIFLAMIVALVITYLFYHFGVWQDPTTMGGAIFASWAGGVALFVVVGLIIAIVSLVRPEEESFDARAKILFRRETGAHIDYIVKRIKDILEHYAESTEILTVIKDYHPESDTFRVQSTVKTIVRSYLDDVGTKYKADCNLKGATASPAGQAQNRFAYLKVSDQVVGLPEEFQSSMQRDVVTTIPEDGFCSVEYMYEVWVRAEKEENTYAPRRYTQSCSLVIQNLCQNRPVVKIALERGGPHRTIIELAHGQSETLINASNIEPEVEVYDFQSPSLLTSSV